MPTSQGFRALRVYQLAFKLAMEIYNESKHFPPEEKVLVDRPNSSCFSKCGNEHWRRISAEAVSEDVC